MTAPFTSPQFQTSHVKIPCTLTEWKFKSVIFDFAVVRKFEIDLLKVLTFDFKNAP
jgi:hypothetical protein